MESRGLGDTIKKFTEVTGIDTLIEYVEELTESECGCDKRRVWLNDQFPYKLNKNKIDNKNN